MKPKITFISASAGSGKTYRVVEEIQRRLTDGKCRPGGLIATTFTVKAAAELKDRLRQDLYGTGQSIIAERLNEAAIGTVDSVCRQLLERFAFDAGISPKTEIITGDQAAELLAQAIEAATSAVSIEKLQKMAGALGQKTTEGEFIWQEQVRRIINAAQANDFDPGQLAAMAGESSAELIELLQPPTKEDLDAALNTALEDAITQISSNGDSTRATDAFVGLLKESHRRLADGNLPWSDWVKLSNSEPGAKSKVQAAGVIAVAGRYESHPRFHDQLKEYIQTVFEFAQRAMVKFSELKKFRGWLDFSDLEQLAYHLLRDHHSIISRLQEELDLLVVDEFQDTSPIQLALFMQLASCAKQTVWVGDVKQAIYGFRDSDPVLIDAVVNSVEVAGGLAEPLDISYRSLPDLVQLTNSLFVPAFAASLGLPEKQVRLKARAGSRKEPQAALEFLELSSGQFNKGNGKPKRLTNDLFWTTLAEQVAQWFESKNPVQVRDRATGLWRDLEPRDVAVLCRKNDEATLVSSKFSARGVSVNLEQAGLFATPEVRFALACLRRLADPQDTLATAEIIALGGSLTPEEWLAGRLKYLATLKEGQVKGGDNWGVEQPHSHPIIAGLEAARSKLNVLAPAEALDLAMSLADAPAVVSAWGFNHGQASQRRANLEALRILCREYEKNSASNVRPATIAGFFWWCEQKKESDLKGLDPEANAIHVGTYHRAKGLEWPVVVCTGLATEPRPRVWDIVVEPAKLDLPFDSSQPLSNRRVRFWPWPFGQASSGIPLDTRAAQSVRGVRAERQALQEELRLLYVGLTRARDRIVLAWDSAQPKTWLDGLAAPWFEPVKSGVQFPDKTWLLAEHVKAVPPTATPSLPPVSHFIWFPAAKPRTAILPAQLIPSHQSPVQKAGIKEIVELDARVPLKQNYDEVNLGDALHAILAAEMIHPGHPDREATAAGILKGFNLQSVVEVSDVLAMVDRFKKWAEDRFQPKSVLVEVPFEYINEAGQRVAGFIDLLLETEAGWIVVDHKTFPGPRKEWAAKALSYSGQLNCYRQALAKNGRQCLGLWIHFAVGGGLGEINWQSSPSPICLPKTGPEY
jgi:ATP-dependent exoDNAse (exonuclease V) beta subunit